jgi:hypothetical protein
MPSGGGRGANALCFGVVKKAIKQLNLIATAATFQESSSSSDQLRDQRGQGAKYWPPFAPWQPLGPVRSWVGLYVVGGVQLGPWAAGFGGR